MSESTNAVYKKEKEKKRKGKGFMDFIYGISSNIQRLFRNIIHCLSSMCSILFPLFDVINNFVSFVSIAGAFKHGICRGLPSITGIAGAEPCRKTGN
jgi:uncharacterized membrane protein